MTFEDLFNPTARGARKINAGLDNYAASHPRAAGGGMFNPNDPNEASSVTAAQANLGIQDLLGSIKARGAARKKMTYQATLGGAQDRGIAFGQGGASLGVPGVSGLAGQSIAPALADVQAQTDQESSTATQNEINRLDDLRQRAMDRQAAADEAKRKRRSGGISGLLSGALTGFAVGGPVGAVVGGAAGAYGGSQ